MSLAVGPRLDLRQTQSLVMTPQLQQAIKLLQFSNLEVTAFVEAELERNPLLERDEGGDAEGIAPEPPAVADEPPADAAFAAASELPLAEAPLEIPDHAEPYDPGSASDGVPPGPGGHPGFEDDERGIDGFAAPVASLREHLSEQLRLAPFDADERLIGAAMIALLDPSGRLLVSDTDIATALGTEVARVAGVRARLLHFDPTGMFARDLRQCLAAQLAEKNRLDPAMAALLDHLDLLARRDWAQLSVLCGVDGADLADMVAELKRLDPKPGALWDATPPAPLVADVLLRDDGHGGWLLELNPETLPRVLVREGFAARALLGASREDRVFLTERLQSATWLVKALQQRAETILKVTAEIVRQQDAFFRRGIAGLRPLILRDIAAAVGMHESTVSRVTAHKYVATPRGIFELKYFFTTAIPGIDGTTHSAESVRSRIKALVDAEPATRPLSDDAIVAALRREGVDIARRTVAKYRDALRIPSSVQRKREKATPA